MHFYVMEKFCDFFTLRSSDLNTTLTYVLMDYFCPCFLCFPDFKIYIMSKIKLKTAFSLD